MEMLRSILGVSNKSWGMGVNLIYQTHGIYKDEIHKQ